MKTKIFIQIITWSSKTNKDGTRKCIDIEKYEYIANGMIQTSISQENNESHITLWCRKKFDDGRWFHFFELKKHQTYESHIEIIDEKDVD